MFARRPRGGRQPRWAKRLPARAICVMLAALVPAACTTVEIEDHSLQFNQATGSLGNRLLLLNALRAAKGYPLQFSKVTSYQGTSRLDGTLSMTVPFINTIGRSGTASPSAQFKSGVQNLQLSDLNTAEIQQKLRQQVRARDFVYFRSQGWPKALVNTILIESLYVDPTLVEALDEASRSACKAVLKQKRTRDTAQKQECQWRERIKDKGECFAGSKRRVAAPDGYSAIQYTNNPRVYCEYQRFQAFFASIRVLEGVGLEVDPKSDPEECKTTWLDPSDQDRSKKDGKDGKGDKDRSKDAKGEGSAGKHISESAKDGKVSVDVNVKIAEKGEKDQDADGEKGGTIGLNIPRDLNIIPRKIAKDARTPARTREELMEEYQEIIGEHQERIKRLGELRHINVCLLKEGRTPITVIWRSPERMVRYLGDVVAVQIFSAGDNRGPVQILNEDGRLVDLFRVERGRDLLGSRGAVSVEGPERESYFVPASENGSEPPHLSLQALALVMESLNQAVSGKALPQPAAVFLPGG